MPESGVTLLHGHFQLFSQRATFGNENRGEHDESCSLRVAAGASDEVFGGVFLHFAARAGRVGLADAGEEES